ncbi:hypothetical protein RB195_011010 [Necator americanus]|uniref:Uncharacterized protein n=1 Tax=Necator americanus TaxID=51031 RepID=A0ABR1D0L2_NECAM
MVLPDKHGILSKTQRSGWPRRSLSVYLIYLMIWQSSTGLSTKAGLRNDVRVVEIPPANLKAKLVRNRVYDRLAQLPAAWFARMAERVIA